LATSPVDKAALTFTNKTSNIEGLHYFYNSSTGAANTLAVRDSILWSGQGVTWANESAPDYGSVLVDGAAQTGASLIVDAVASDTYVPHVGSTFSIAGVEKVYTVLAAPTITSGGGTISIYPSLASSPADNAVITFLSVSATGGSKLRFHDFNFDSTKRVALVDGVNYPAAWDESGGLTVIDTNADLVGASTVTTFKSHLFFGVGNKLIFSAPFSFTDYTPANGSGVLTFPSNITGIIEFREKLIVFTTSSIHQLVGSSQADFALSGISDDLGCVSPDTIAEVGGDILFLGPDGLRFLGATARIGDFNLSLASRGIQDDVTTLVTDFTSLTGVVVRGKSQYRLFGYSAGTASSVTSGYIGTQFSDQEATGFNWGQTSGIKAYRTVSKYVGSSEVVLFCGEDGYVYEMESGNTFDGTAISASFYLNRLYKSSPPPFPPI
jgi:hypothetical protein